MVGRIGQAIAELLSNQADVSINSPSINDVLTWNGTQWVNGPPILTAPYTLTPPSSILKGLILKGADTLSSVQPNTISNLQLWLKADALALADGVAVGTWTDSSGNNFTFTQTNASLKPIYKTSIVNGQPIVRFSIVGSNSTNVNRAHTAALDITGDMTMFMVIKPSQTGYAAIFSNMSEDYVSGWQALIDGTASAVYIGSGDTNFYTSPYLVDIVNTITDGNFHILEITRSGNQIYVKTDGLAGLYNAPGIVSASANNTHYLGAEPNGSGGSDNGGFVGDIAEYILYSAVLTETQKTQIRKYLAAKYGLTTRGEQIADLLESQDSGANIYLTLDGEGNLASQGLVGSTGHLSQDLYVDKNLGVGTTNPQTQAEIVGTLRISNTGHLNNHGSIQLLNEEYLQAKKTTGTYINLVGLNLNNDLIFSGPNSTQFYDMDLIILRNAVINAGITLATNGHNAFLIEETGGNFNLRGDSAVRLMIVTQSGQTQLGQSISGPATSAVLDLTSTTGALLVPRMTTTQKNALTAVNGMIVYDATLNKFQGYENGAWTSFI